MEKLLTSIAETVARRQLPVTYEITHRGPQGGLCDGQLRLELMLQNTDYVIASCCEHEADFELYGDVQPHSISDVLVWFTHKYPSPNIISHTRSFPVIDAQKHSTNVADDLTPVAQTQT